MAKKPKITQVKPFPMEISKKVSLDEITEFFYAPESKMKKSKFKPEKCSDPKCTLCAEKLAYVLPGDTLPSTENIQVVPNWEVSQNSVDWNINYKLPDDSVDTSFEGLDKKDLIGVIHNLLEESGGTVAEVKKAGTTYMYNDTIVTKEGKRTFLSFRSLIDKRDE